MKNNKISKQFGIYRFVTPPFFKVLFPFIRFFQTMLAWQLKGNNEIAIVKEKINLLDHSERNIYIFEPTQKKITKTLLYIHGGAFVFKGNNKHFKLCQKYAKEGECRVIFIDYRLAPKFTYPIPLQDCISAYQWIVKENKNQEIIIGGDSAGGLLTIDLTIEIIKNKLPKPKALMLIYPLIDPFMTSNSMKKYTKTPMWNSKLNQKMWNLYLKNHSYSPPINQPEIAQFPLTYLETAEFDCLHDEGIIFAQKLKEHSVECIMNETLQTMHAFDHKECKITNKAVQERIKFLKK
ncbi:MAG: alpha/beta hydrolase [Bacilli bacterium]|nr:alpha/beta hydrolase [Bacilli bacterium]